MEETKAAQSWAEIRPILDSAGRGFPRAEAQAVRDRPELLEALVADLEALAEAAPGGDHRGMLHIVGMFLLAALRDRRLVRPLLALARGRGDQLDATWGDWLTEGWQRAAAAVCSTDELRAVVEDESYDEWVRALASSAMLIQVFEGDLERRPTVDYAIARLDGHLASLAAMTRDEFDEQPFVLFDHLADIVGDLGEPDDLPHIERWFRAGMLSSMHAGLDFYRRELAEPFTARRARALAGNDCYIREPFERLEGAYCYSEEFHSRSRQSTQAQTVATSSGRTGRHETYVRVAAKIGRNDPCVCGSGKKYKKCCGA